MTRDLRESASWLAGIVIAMTGWSPDQFWNATPAEIESIFSAFSDRNIDDQGLAPLSTEQLEKLKKDYPDAKSNG